MFAAADQDALLQYLVHSTLGKLGTSTVVQMRESFITQLQAMLSAYRGISASLSSPSQVSLPDTLLHLPLLALGLLKSPAYRLLGETKVDEKFAEIMKLMYVSFQHFQRRAHPRLYQLTTISDNAFGYTDEESGKTVKPYCCNLTQEYLTTEDLCLIDTGDVLYLWVGS